MSAGAAATGQEPANESFFGRIGDNIRAGNLGSWPVLIGLVVIATFFSFKADNFLSPGNFSNIVTQMAGVTLLAYGVVFVLLIGEIDLSISYISGIAGVVVAQMTLPDPGIRSRASSPSCSPFSRVLRSERSRAPSWPSSACRPSSSPSRATRSGRA